MKKYRLLIVDDEDIVREAIKNSIPWERYRIEIAYCAANSPDAISWLKLNSANLVLTDIRMPEIDGLMLVELIRRDYPMLEVILISGYADFEYARRAMRFGVRDYLLKPVDTNTLINAVCKARDEWESQANSSNDTKTLKTRTRYSPTVTRLMNLLDEEIANEELSLKWISHQRMFLNENYLGKLFQKETGQKFTAYMYEKRMSLAADLIRADPDILVQEVAERTGYGGNSGYFSIAFKKYTGLTPSEFRKNLTQVDD